MLFDYDALWEYQFVANTVPPDFGAVDVPDASWLGPAPAPFGTMGNSFTTNLLPATAWALGVGMWARRALVVDGQSAVLLRGQIENSCSVYLDGQFVGGFNIDNSNIVDGPRFELVLPRSLLTEGAHELAVLCLDEAGGGGDTTYFWMEAEVLPAVLALWPAPGMGEAVAWLNDVTVYEDGSEDRERLRNAPRHQYRMNCYVPPAVVPSLRNALWGARAQQWLVPVWSQIQHLGPVVPGEITLDVLTSYSEYAANSLLILWQTPLRWQVIGIEKINSADALTLTAPTEEFEDAWVAPLHKAYMEGDPRRAFDGRQSRLSVTMNVETNRALTVAAPSQYLGNDIYFDPGLLEGNDSDEAITTSFQLLDEALGLVDYSSPWLHNRPARSHRMMAEDAEEAWELREWLHRRAGRLTPFWHPSFEVDLRVLNTGMVTNQLLVAADDYLRFAEARDHLAIETTAGWMAVAVTATLSIDESQTQLTISAPVGLDATAIKRVCFLGLRRLNSDRVEISWIGGTVCTCAVPVLDIEP